jgi:predicted acetylornithine/succinylornithine family transaminase
VTTPLALTPLLPTYTRQDVTLVRGEGSWVWDDQGTRYLDLVAGIAVVALGHGHPAPLAAAHAQLDRLWHVSNLYWTEPMQSLASRLSGRFGGGAAFFCNSGAEAIEAALKWARKATGRAGIVALENSFHGRTMGALAVTGQPAKRAPFEPLVGPVSFARLNDEASLRELVGGDTAAILLEPIQGEGGIHAATTDFLATARALADEHGALLILDEIQTGVGRTGSFFAWEQLGMKPDAVTLAKGLANGLPIGCLIVADGVETALVPGDHGSTFGGNPVTCAAACAVCDEITEELLAGVSSRGLQLTAGLAGLAGVKEVRGRGLLLAADLDRPAAEAVDAARARGLLIGTAGDRTLRLTPALTISRDEIAQALDILDEVLV